VNRREEAHEPGIYQGPARALVRLKPTAPTGKQRNHAVTYLRVSTPGQVKTDYDPEGISLPTQRNYCAKKAADDGLRVIEEYVEPGRTATRMDQRPVFQQMLERIRRDRDVDYIIVYQLSRLNRDWIDSAAVLMELRSLGVTIVSATEGIDESPEGILLMGVLSAINGFRSAGDGKDIRIKMGEKAKKGGTLGPAPLGYLNVRDRFDGREIRTVAIDPERAPLIAWAFERFATGELSIEQLRDELTTRGLVTRKGPRSGGPIGDTTLRKLLTNPYYCGVVTYQGELYKGRHEPLISEGLFERVQDVLAANARADVRNRKYPHYLKGAVFCGRCHNDGVDSRLFLQRAQGHGGEYFYFFCARKQQHLCDTRYVRMEDIEDAVEAHYRTVRFTPDFTASVRALLQETLDDHQSAAEVLRGQVKAQLATLDVREENLLDLVEQETGSKDKLRARLDKIMSERAKLEEKLAEGDLQLDVGVQLLQAALELLRKPYELYRQSGPKFRRTLNRAIFRKLYIDDNEVTDAELQEPFAELLEAQTRIESGDTAVGIRRRGAGLRNESNADLLVLALTGQGSSKATMVEVMGLEPTTSTLRT
jgi:site-specific DNA recombinase